MITSNDSVQHFHFDWVYNEGRELGIPVERFDSIQNNCLIPDEQKILKIDAEITLQKRYNEGKEAGIPVERLNHIGRTCLIPDDQKIPKIEREIQAIRAQKK